MNKKHLFLRIFFLCWAGFILGAGPYTTLTLPSGPANYWVQSMPNGLYCSAGSLNGSLSAKPASPTHSIRKTSSSITINNVNGNFLQELPSAVWQAGSTRYRYTPDIPISPPPTSTPSPAVASSGPYNDSTLPAGTADYWLAYNGAAYWDQGIRSSFEWAPTKPANPMHTVTKSGSTITSKIKSTGQVYTVSPNTYLYYPGPASTPAPAAPSIPGGITVNSGVYDGFGWQAIPTPSNNVTVTFKAIATTDLHVGFKYGTNQYVEIVVGGWGNKQCAVRNFSNGGLVAGSEWLSGMTAKVMPDTINPVSYTVTIVPVAGTSDGLLTVTASGAASPIISRQIGYLNNIFTGYSFHTAPPTSWVVGNYAVTSVPPVATAVISSGPYDDSTLPAGTAEYWLSYFNGGYWDQGQYQWATIKPASALHTVTKSGSTITCKVKATGLTYTPYANYYKYYPVAAATVAAAPVGTTVTSFDYSTAVGGSNFFGWKSIAPSTNNLKLVFTGTASADLHIALRYGANSYLEIPVGGWANARSALRTFCNGAQVGGDEAINPSAQGTAVVPDTVNPVNYTLTIIPDAASGYGVMTLMGATKAGANVQIFSYKSLVLNQGFTGYSFRTANSNRVIISGDSVAVSSSVVFNGQIITSNNYDTAISSVVSSPVFFNWKPISPVSNNFRISFSAATKSDVCLALKFGTNSYTEMVVGGWGNTSSVFRSISNGAKVGGDQAVAAVLPDVSNIVSYTITVAPDPAVYNGGILTITGIKSGTSTVIPILSCKSTAFNQPFTAYSFKTYNVSGASGTYNSLNITGDAVSAVAAYVPPVAPIPVGYFSATTVPSGDYWVQNAPNRVLVTTNPTYLLSCNPSVWGAKPATPNITVVANSAGLQLVFKATGAAVSYSAAQYSLDPLLNGLFLQPTAAELSAAGATDIGIALAKVKIVVDPIVFAVNSSKQLLVDVRTIFKNIALAIPGYTQPLPWE